MVSDVVYGYQLTHCEAKDNNIDKQAESHISPRTSSWIYSIIVNAEFCGYQLTSYKTNDGNTEKHAQNRISPWINFRFAPSWSFVPSWSVMRYVDINLQTIRQWMTISRSRQKVILVHKSTLRSVLSWLALRYVDTNVLSMRQRMEISRNRDKIILVPRASSWLCLIMFIDVVCEYRLTHCETKDGNVEKQAESHISPRTSFWICSIIVSVVACGYQLTCYKAKDGNIEK